MKLKRVLSLAFAAVLPLGTANAALIDSAKLTSSEAFEVEISGSVDGKKNNRYVSLYVTEEALGEENPVYVNSEEISFDGEYTHKVKIDASSGKFTVTAVSDGKKELKTINYASSEWLDQNVYDKVANDTLGGTELLNTLLTYDIAMGLDFSDIKSDRDKNILVKRVEEAGSEFKSNKETVAQNVKTEIKFLEDLKSASHWTVAEKLVKDSVSVSKIDLTKYNQASNKSEVMGSLIGVDFENFEQVGEAINSNSVVSSGSGGSGTGGGGGGGGSSSGGSGGGSGFLWSGNTAGGVLAQNPPKQYGFVDLDSVEWAKEAINALYAKGVISGIDDNTFAPEDNVTREQFAKLAVLAFGFDTKNQNASFSDVDKTRWSYPYIACGYNLGVIKGTSENRFEPEANISRQDMAVILARCAEACGIDLSSEKTDFSDWESVSDYAKEAVGALAGGGYINGTGDGAFEPKAAATRAEAAKILYELMKGAEK